MTPVVQLGFQGPAPGHLVDAGGQLSEDLPLPVLIWPFSYLLPLNSFLKRWAALPLR